MIRRISCAHNNCTNLSLYPYSTTCATHTSHTVVDKFLYKIQHTDHIESTSFAGLTIHNCAFNAKQFINCDFSYAQINYSQFNEASFINCFFNNTQFYNCQLRYSIIAQSHITATDIAHCDFSYAQFYTINSYTMNIIHSQFSHNFLYYIYASNITIKHSNFDDCSLHKIFFNGNTFAVNLRQSNIANLAALNVYKTLHTHTNTNTTKLLYKMPPMTKHHPLSRLLL